MKAEEIRKWHNDLEKLKESGDLKPHEVVSARARIEIAAQLAEISEHLISIENNTYGSTTLEGFRR